MSDKQPFVFENEVRSLVERQVAEFSEESAAVRTVRAEHPIQHSLPEAGMDTPQKRAK